MKRRTFISMMSVMAAAGVLTLSGCSNSSTSTAASSGASSAAGSAADQLAAIQASGKLIVALEGAWQPWSYHDESDTLVGYDVEVSRAIAEKLGVEPEYVESDWDSLFAGLDAGRFDMVCNGVEVTDERALTVGPGLKSGIKLRLDNPAQLGAELLCGAVAALAESAGPLVVISADTAISMMAVNEKQELVGGVILPGPQLSLETLVKSTAQLPQIDLAAKAPESILGKSTAACLQNGFVLGTASQLDGLAARFCAELSPQTAFYATGNLPRAIRDACRTPIRYRETLITDGLYRIWQKNRKG